MNLLARHILKEILIATGIAMALFVFVLLIGNVVRDIASLVASGRLDPVVFAKLIGLLIPYVASYALPLGILTGTLIALGRLSSQHEITAMKASGVSIMQVAAPVFFAAFLGMVLNVVINFEYGPRARVAYKELLRDSVLAKPISFIEEKRFVKDFPGIVFYIDEKEGNQVRGFWAWELDEQGRVRRFARAQEGEIAFDREALKLVLTLRDVAVELREGADSEAFEFDVRTANVGELPVALPLDDLVGVSEKKRDLKEMTLGQLLEVRGRELADEEGAGLGAARLRVQLEIQKNFAMAFSVFSLAIFGVPLAIRVGRKESHANLAIAVALAFGYYYLTVVVTWFENSVALRPDLLVWLPNIAFQVAGVYALNRLSRH